MLNICHVITRLIVGGAQENTVLTCKGLVEKGHRVTLLSGPETGSEGSLWPEAEEAGCDLITIDSLRRAVRPWSDVRAFRELRCHFVQLRPDVVHTHSSKAGILGRKAVASAGVPAVVHTIHGMSFNRTQPTLVQAAFRHLERRVGEKTAAFITVADAMIDQAVAAGIAPRDRFRTIRSGMVTERYGPDPEARRHWRGMWGLADDDIVVGTMARLFRNKGYEEVIEAMPSAVERLPRLRFVWLGDGIDRTVYEQRLERIGLRDRVHLAGLIPPHRIGACTNGFDILLHASKWEGLPRAIVQGLLTEKPAISFDNDGSPEVVIPGQTGILVRLGDISGLADALVDLGSDSALRRRLGRAGRLFCLERFDWRDMVDRIEQLYGRVVAMGPAPGTR